MTGLEEPGHLRPGSMPDDSDEALFNTKGLETFSRKVTATAGHLINPPADHSLSQHYQHAMTDIHREFRNPLLQRQVFSISQTSPRDFVRTKLSPTEIQHRALAYLPDDLLRNLPESSNPFSLFQGFQASLPESSQNNRHRRRRHGRHSSRRQQQLLEDADIAAAPPAMKNLRNEKHSLDHKLETLDIRRNMCSTEIHEIDNKIVSLNNMRKVVLDRLTDLEQEEVELESEVIDVETRIDDLQEQLDDEAALRPQQKTPTTDSDPSLPKDEDIPAKELSFMSDSIYSKLPASGASKSRRPRPGRRKTDFVLHSHLSAGSSIRQIHAHEDQVSAVDFDVPFGTMVTAALDDTIRVWDLSAGRCIGLLEGHLSSVRCLQVEDTFVATGSMDATVRLWDLGQAEYGASPPTKRNREHSNKITNEARISSSGADEESKGPMDLNAEDDLEFADTLEFPSPSNMRHCAVHTLSAHVAEVTALHFHNNTLVSGSADKTLRQWDLEKGRCVQTLDVLWAAAQAASTHTVTTIQNVGARSRATGADAAGDFVGALQCFDAALACGTADGMVRLWDLRSGMVHRSLVGHTGPVTCLQFDETFLVTGSVDRSVRIWDLRTGSIFDAYAYDNPITSMSFDARNIAAAAGESVVKIYDKAEAKHWGCGEFGDGEGKREQESATTSIVDRIRLRDGYLVGGRKDGTVGVWSV